MKIEYHKWWSPSLNQDMELKVYGHSGKPVLVFPCQCGRFYEFEDFGMINLLSVFIEQGRIKVFTVDSLDAQSWANPNAHPAQRALRHNDYDRYIVHEVIPFIKGQVLPRLWRDPSVAGKFDKCLTTGCSAGAYHAANFFFRHPDIFDSMIALSGLYQLSYYIGTYMDENVYFNTPLAYLPNLQDAWFLERYRRSRIVFCAGQGAWEDTMLADTRAMQAVLENKQIPAWIDYWGHDVNHDWPWWRKQLPYFLDKMLS
jgi:esterase/lipase superfamily enzyme